MYGVIRGTLVVVVCALATALAMTAGEMEDAIAAAWAGVDPNDRPIQNAVQCTGTNFAALAAAIGDALGAAATVGASSWQGTNPNTYCEFTVSLSGEGGAELVEVIGYFSPSALAPASARHIHGVVRFGGTSTYVVQLKGNAGTTDRLDVDGPTVAAGELVEGCFTPALVPFAGPSPSDDCEPDKGHGRWADDEPVDPPVRGRSEDAPGRNR